MVKFENNHTTLVSVAITWDFKISFYYEIAATLALENSYKPKIFKTLELLLWFGNSSWVGKKIRHKSDSQI